MRTMTHRHGSKQKGFTLIELIVVIVIIGILAAVAIPKFTGVSDDAKQAVVDGVAGNIASAAATNYGLRQLTPPKGVAVTACDTTTIGTLMDQLPTGTTAAGTLAACVITLDGKTATIVLKGA